MWKLFRPTTGAANRRAPNDVGLTLLTLLLLPLPLLTLLLLLLLLLTLLSVLLPLLLAGCSLAEEECGGVSAPPSYCDQKVASREIRVWHFVIENGSAAGRLLASGGGVWRGLSAAVILRSKSCES
jgi:hypothetical protein